MRNLIFSSILLNLFLVGAVAYQFSHRNVADTVQEESSNVSGSATTTNKVVKKRKVQDRTVVNVETPEFTWASIEAEDYKKYIANLRSINCPEETIRDIIIAEVEKYYAKKLALLRRPQDSDYKFWKREAFYGQSESAEYYKASREIEKEKKALLRELLGVDYADEQRKRWGWYEDDDPFKGLAPEKKDQMADIDAKYSQMEQEVYRRTKGEIYQEDTDELNRIRKDQKEEMAKILSPDEFLEWQLRYSRTARDLKNGEMQAFDATEDEFRAIFKAKEALGDRSRTDDNNDKSAAEKRRELAKQTAEELKGVLGEDRYKEYELAQNWEYRQLAQTTDRLNLPRDSAKKIYDMKADVETAARNVNQDKSLTAEQRQEKLQLLKDATRDSIVEVLGEKGFKAFKRNAYWFDNIAPKKPKTSP